MNNTVSEIEISYTLKFLTIDQDKVTSLNHVYQIFMNLFDPKLLTVKEECFALFLNRNNRIFGSYKVSSGGITGTVVAEQRNVGIEYYRLPHMGCTKGFITRRKPLF